MGMVLRASRSSGTGLQSIAGQMDSMYFLPVESGISRGHLLAEVTCGTQPASSRTESMTACGLSI
jgi:hypothetical protein